MTFDEYQQAALRTARAKNKKNELFHLVLGLVGETGEIAEKMKKWVRDQGSDERLVDTDDLKKELGDVLWYVAVLARYFDISLEEIAAKNVTKLADRQQRNVLSGSGDNR
jgi:NTP pyrophosphatase (non-canonical NTP hydrolase)